MDPETGDEGTKLRINNLEFGEKEKYRKAGVIYVSLNKNGEIMRGDTLTLNGKLTEGFGIYVGYMYRPIIKEWQRQVPGDWVIDIRNAFAKRIGKLIPEPELELGLSYLLGMKSGLPDDLSEKLRIVGLMHIVVASGAHLGILVGIVRKLFGGLSRFVELLFSTLFVVLFMMMVGWTPSIMRAGVMVILSLVAWFHGREIAAWRMILLLMAITLMINPMFLVDLGWLFSFASFIGIMVIAPMMRKFFYGKRKPGFVASLVITTLSATMMTLPITLYYYGVVSWISLVANMLILPTLSWAMGLVFLTGVVAGIPGIENVVAFLAKQLLSFHIWIVELFGGMREFVVTMPQYQGWVFLIYAVVGAVIAMKLVRGRHTAS
jgi:competence protein ComEC